VYPSQWESSVHGNPETLSRGASAGCAPCHSGSGFVAWIKNDKQSLSAAPELAPIGCAVCHDPHNADNEYQLRTVEATLTNGEVVTGGGNGKLCMNCHKSRRNAADYTGPDFSYSSHFGPHYSTQADLLIGTNVPTFGKTLPTSPHFAGLENACVDCHMYEHGSHGEHDAEGNLNTAGMHSFSMVSASGVDNVAACADCHGEFGESFSEKKYFLNGVADHDGDGMDEGLQEEIHGILEELAMMLPPVGENEVDMGGDFEFTLGEVKAAYNYFSVEEDRSMGIHNPAFIVALLHVSMQAVENSAVVGGIAAVEDLPNDQGKQVKVIWNKFVDDGVAADPVQLYVVKRYDDYDETWTGVATHPADGSARYAMVVPTVFDSTADGDGMTMFMVEAITAGGNVHHSEPADGYSVDNLVPMAPGGFAALIAGMDVNLSWDATDDPDVKYYAVHRSTTEGFVPSEETQLATTSELLFSDKDVAEGKYYYRVLAVDFSGNVGDPSVEVSANITSIDGNNMKPLDFALAQNYPNPFNPTTNIDFSLKEAGRVSLTVYNTLGQEVYRVVDGNYNAGRFTVSFSGNNLSSGVYVYRIQITGANSGEMLFQSMQKMILMK
jgi:hypothetical protein